MKFCSKSPDIQFGFQVLHSNFFSSGLRSALVFFAGAMLFQAKGSTNSLEIQAVEVEGKPAHVSNNNIANLNSHPLDVSFRFGSGQDARETPLRKRYILEGDETAWREYRSEMTLTVRFYNNSSDQIGQNIFTVSGESAKWAASLKDSPLIHRRETVVVPPLAQRLMVVISSAGAPDSVGVYVVANLSVTKSSDGRQATILLQSPFDIDHKNGGVGDPPAGWRRDGTRPSMAKVVKIGQEPQTKAFAILDDSKTSHAEWHNTFEIAPVVAPGQQLVVEWNEMFSMGAGTFHEAHYINLSPDNYKFHVAGLDVMGRPTGVQATVNIHVPQSFWRMSWFWGSSVVLTIIIIIAASRYFIWQRMQLHMAHLKQQNALEQERLRIAHDIHDDLGARVTQISLLSGLAQNDLSFSEKARAHFYKISNMSRDLVLALYETVWAVNPENDNVDALGNYLCQMVKQMCEQTPLRCRFHALGLPREIQISSQARHNISMAVKEAVHNVIKHANAAEITIRIVFSDNFLNISVEDNGKGFRPDATSAGNGLVNMRQRLANIGGQCSIESNPGQTTVQMRLKISDKIK
jgi:signal transduction histidine kinase